MDRDKDRDRDRDMDVDICIRIATYRDRYSQRQIKNIERGIHR